MMAAGAGHDGHATFRLLDRDLDDAPMLVGRHRRRLARRSARNEKVNALLDLPIDEFPERRFVQRAVLREGRDERGTAALESLSHSRQPTRQTS